MKVLNLYKLAIIFIFVLILFVSFLSINQDDLSSFNSKDVDTTIRGKFYDRNGVLLADSKTFTDRNYFYPTEFSHVIGYAREDSGQIKGLYKLEKTLDSYLNNEDSKGSDIYLSIDLDWQRSLHYLLEEQMDRFYSIGASGIIMDTSNGQIMAMSSLPGFDTNKFFQGLTSEYYSELLNDSRLPLIDKATTTPSAPGSIFKIISGYSLLKNNSIDTNTTIYSNRCMYLSSVNEFCEFGKLFYGSMNIQRAIRKSSNIFFCQNFIDSDMYSKYTNLSNETILTNIANLDSFTYFPAQKGRFGISDSNIYAGDICNTIIGQGENLFTPIQFAYLLSLLKNSGENIKPKIVKEIRNSQGFLVKNSEVEKGEKLKVDSNSANIILDSMYTVANDPEGTVYYYLHDLPGNLRVKTGTAEAYYIGSDGSYPTTHGWIVGLFDYNNKTYSFALHTKYGGSGFYIADVLRKFILCLNEDFVYDCRNY